MKSIFTALFALITIAVIYSCNNGNASSSYNRKPNDTAKLVGLFDVGNSFRLDYIFRIAKDTFAIDKKDSTEVKWQRDTIYYAPFFDTVKVPGTVVDTSKTHTTEGTITMVPKLDSLGKPVMKLTWYPYPKEAIYQLWEKTKK